MLHTEAYGVSADDESDDDSGAGDTIMLGIVLCTVGSICLNCGEFAIKIARKRGRLAI